MTALLRASHPAPGAAVVLVSLILSVSAGLPWQSVVLITVVMLFDQLSVGWSNDWLDAGRDRASGRLDKPVAQGLVSVELVRGAAITSLVLSIAVGFALGVLTGLVHTVFVVSAWAYNLVLKRTAMSVLPYALSFGLLPAIVTLSADPPLAPTWWALSAGAALGIAAHLANVLPDLDDDARTGVRGFPHRIGGRASGISAFVILVVASGFIAIGAPSPVTLVGVAVIAVIAAIGCAMVLTGRVSRSLFILILVSALVMVVELALTGSAIAAR